MEPNPMTSLLFYKNVVALDREAHKNLKVNPVPDLGFLADVTAVPIVVGEFADVARQGPIGFLKMTGDEGILPVALLGMPNGRNLYLDAAGKWTGSYIPAFIRRYPFLFSENGERLTVCLDREFPGFSETEGEPLFDATGEPAAFTKNAINLLTEFQRQVVMTQGFVKRLQEAGVFTDSAAEVRLEDGRTTTLNGMMTVDEAKLRAIPETTLKAWFDTGELACVYAHRISLGHLVDLVRKGMNASGVAPPAPAAG
jgi:hypothetical protein